MADDATTMMADDATTMMADDATTMMANNDTTTSEEYKMLCAGHGDCQQLGEGYQCYSSQGRLEDLCPANVDCFCEYKPCDHLFEEFEAACWQFMLRENWCGHGLLPAVVDSCHPHNGCDVSVSTWHLIQYGGTCEAYCASQGLGCKGTTNGMCGQEDVEHLGSCDTYVDYHLEPTEFESTRCICENDGREPRRTRIPKAALAADAQACQGFVERSNSCVSSHHEHYGDAGYVHQWMVDNIWLAAQPGGEKCIMVDPEKLGRRKVLHAAGCNQGP